MSAVPNAEGLRAYNANPVSIITEEDPHHLVEFLNLVAQQLDAIDALHQPAEYLDCETDEVITGLCSECAVWWPCPTTALLHPEVTS